MADEKKKCSPDRHRFSGVGESGGARLEVGQSATCVCGEMVVTLTRANNLAVSTPLYSGSIPLGDGDTIALIYPERTGTDD